MPSLLASWWCSSAMGFTYWERSVEKIVCTLCVLHSPIFRENVFFIAIFRFWARNLADVLRAIEWKHIKIATVVFLSFWNIALILYCQGNTATEDASVATVAGASFWCDVWSNLAHCMIPVERIWAFGTVLMSWPCRSNTLFAVLGLPVLRWIVWLLAERLASFWLLAIVAPAWLCSRGSIASVGIPQQVSLFNGTSPWIDECVVLPTSRTAGPSSAWVDSVWLMLSKTQEPDAGSQQAAKPTTFTHYYPHLPLCCFQQFKQMNESLTDENIRTPRPRCVVRV